MSNARRNIAMWIWGECHGLPYRWGGDDPGAGFDCSGMVIEGLKGAGILPRDGDWTAQGLAERFRYKAVHDESVSPGCLLFWKRGTDRAQHVEVVWQIVDGQVLTIGASGGGSRTRTLDDAIAQNAFVKIRPARPGWFAVDPFIPDPFGGEGD